MRNRIGTSARISLATAGLLAALGIAACGGGGDEGLEGGQTTTQAPVAEAQGKPSGELTISNWPFYIDRDTVPDFEQATGISVKDIEDVSDNPDFFGKMQPLLDQGDSGGRSLFMVTDWMAKKMWDLGYLQRLDKEAIAPAETHLNPTLKHPSIDPNREYTLPWQGGMTGLVVNSELAPDVTSINDLFDPKYKGQVEMLSELRDTVPLVMKAMGVDPTQATEDDWMAAIDKVKEAADAGQIRKFTGNDYTRDLANNDAAAVIGWSGDAIQLQADNPDIKFVMPDEGCMLWFDDMVIPVGAPNPTAAYAWMNYVYEPKNHAQIADYNYYFTPVDGVKPILAKQGSDAAKSQLVFPSQKYIADCTTQDNPQGGPEVEQRIERAWQAVVTGG
ncbi:MAG: PotD/PotF family extracellular solute-binding protein [Solirubrobacterales bacterium]